MSARHFGPITAADRERAAIPARFATWEAYRAYMREYVADWRARRRPGAAHRATVTATADPAPRRIVRPGYCTLCGHRSPDPACPVCVDELERGGHVTPEAWRRLVAVDA